MQVAEVNIANAMKSIDQEDEIDYSVGLNMQLLRQYKNKLNIASGHLLNQIGEQNDEFYENIRTINY